MPVPSDVVSTVRTLLNAAGLTVSEEELQSFVETYPLMREGADRLYIEELRYEEPAAIFAPLAVVRGGKAGGGR